MRILALTNLYPNPYQPHRAAFNRQDLRLLAERHPVRVIAPILWTDERQAAARLLPPDRRVVHDGLTVDHPRYWYTPKMLRGQYGRFYQWSVGRTFRRAAAEFAPDVVYAPWAYPDGWAGVRLARRAGLPVVVKVHGSDLRALEEFPGRRANTAAALREADAVVVVSRDLAGRAAALGADPARVRVVQNGIDRKTFCPGDRAAARAAVGVADDGTRHLLFVGNLLPIKGVDILVEACGQLPTAAGRWVLHLIGSGPLRGELEARAAALGVADRVRFHGPRPHAELPDWFRAADLFVLASRSEGVPNVLLEAAGCGTPFVATAVGGVPEVAHLGAGVLIPPDDPNRLAAGIVEVLDRPPPAPAEGPRDRRRTAADLEAVLASVVSNKEEGTRNTGRSGVRVR
ncbi:MAG: glycosyltransferase [Gemmataceae bacterium]|nr:glycosyltransferase [Gemmataceae bacterium]